MTADRGGGPIRRVAILSVHTSPLDQPGTGDGGGLNVYVREVARRMATAGVAVDVFTRGAGRRAAVVEADGGVRVHQIPAGPPGPLGKEELANHLAAFLDELEAHVATAGTGQAYDVVHAHYWMSGWVGLRLRQRWQVPLVQTFHTLGRVKEGARTAGEPPEPELRILAEERLIATADRIVVPVCGEARLLHRTYGTSGARLAVVRPGVDPAVFHPGPAGGASAAPPGDGPLLLFVGRLQPLKAPDVAVRAFAHVRAALPGARLLVVGGASGPAGACHPEALAALARDLGVGDAVAFAPARPQRELAVLYRTADLVLVPSRSESFGLVALEAQACGTPVVAARVGGLAAVVGDGGALVDGHDPRDHADAALELLADRERYARASAAGRQAAATSTWDRTTERLLEVYADAAGLVPVREAGA